MSSPAAAPAPAGSKPGKPAGRRKWLFRLAALVLGPVVVFALLELGLRIGGYGRSTAFFLDGSRVEGHGLVVENPEFGHWVFPRSYTQTPAPVALAMAREKPAGTCRVFVLGESAAMGFPDPAVSFGRILEVLLRARYPNTRFEVINAAVTAINSHVVLPIARECAGYGPDLFVVHVGNNEVVGPFGAAGVLGPSASSLAVVRANLGVKRARVGQLLDSIVHGFGGDNQSRPWGGMEMFLGARVPEGDERLARVYAHFRQNIDDICAVGTRAEVPVVLCTIPGNLRDSAPFLSAHAAGLTPEQEAAWKVKYEAGVQLEAAGRHADALAAYDEAARIDGQFADQEFRAGRCLSALGRADEALVRYTRARDLDALRFRTDTTLNRTIRDVAAARAGGVVFLADAEQAFAAASPGGAPGEELFLEHVHMTFAGNYLLARTILDRSAPALDAKYRRAEGDAEPPAEDECRARLAYTALSELVSVTQVYESLLTHAPFTNQLDATARDARWSGRIADLKARLSTGATAAAKVFEKAIAENRGDWMMRMNYGHFLTDCGQLDGAEEQYRAVLTRLKHYHPAYCRLGDLALQQGRPQVAADHYREALRLSPEWAAAHYGLAEALAAQGQVKEGRAIFDERLRRDGDRSAVLLALGGYLMRHGGREDAAARLEEAAALRPDNPAPHFLLGEIAAASGRRDAAVAHYEQALRLKPNWPEARDRLEAVKTGRPPAGPPK